MKARARSFRNDSGSQSRPGDARKRPGPLLGILRFRPRRAALILVALALAITIAGFAGALTTPDRPTVAAAASNEHSSPVVRWTEPGHPGPDIADYGGEDYDLRYRIGGSSDEFTDAEYAGDQTTVTVTVTGLDANTTQRRAQWRLPRRWLQRPDRRDRPCRRPGRGNHALVGHDDGGEEHRR